MIEILNGKSYFGHLYTLSCENATRLNFAEFAKKLIEDTVKGELKWRNEYEGLSGSKVVCLNDEKDIWARIFIIETPLFDGRSRIYVEAGYGTTRDNGTLRFRDANHPSVCSEPGDPEWTLAHALWMAVDYQMKQHMKHRKYIQYEVPFRCYRVKLHYPSDGGEPTVEKAVEMICRWDFRHAKPSYCPSTRTATGYVACRTMDEAIESTKRYFGNSLMKWEIQYHLTGAKLLVADVAPLKEPESIQYCFDEDGYNPYVKAVVLAESADQAKEYVKSWADDNPGQVWEIGYYPPFNEFFSVRKCTQPLKDIKVEEVAGGDTVTGFVFARTKELAKDYIRKKYRVPKYPDNRCRQCGEIPEDKCYYVCLRKDASDGIIVNEVEYPGVIGIGEDENGFYSGYILAKDIDEAVQKATSFVRFACFTFVGYWYSVDDDGITLSANQNLTRKDIGLKDHLHGGVSGYILATDSEDAKRVVAEWTRRNILPKTMNIKTEDGLRFWYDVEFDVLSLYGLKMSYATRMDDRTVDASHGNIRQLGTTIHAYFYARNVDEAKKMAKERLEAMGYYVVS